MLKVGEIQHVSSNMRPLLTEENKLKKVSWALSMILLQTIVLARMPDYEVFAEKVFYMSETPRTCYLG